MTKINIYPFLSDLNLLLLLSTVQSFTWWIWLRYTLTMAVWTKAEFYVSSQLNALATLCPTIGGSNAIVSSFLVKLYRSLIYYMPRNILFKNIVSLNGKANLNKISINLDSLKHVLSLVVNTNIKFY